MLADLSIKNFLDKTASGSPVPGGGSVAALSGATAASLIEMVANLSMGKDKNKDLEDEMKRTADIARSLKHRLVQDIDRDSESYSQVVEAYRLPKTSQAEISRRKVAIQNALKHAALVPLSVAKTTFELMDHAGTVVKKGNPNAVTDAAVAAMQARTAVQGALLNVKINLASIKDEEFKKETYKQIKMLEKEAVNKEHNILSRINL